MRLAASDAAPEGPLVEGDQMRELRDAVSICARPEQIWDWLSGLAANYQAWHPDHVQAKWERGGPHQTGSILRAVEDLRGRREVLRLELTRIDPPHRLEYRLHGPISILLPRGAFTVTSDDDGSRFVASISYRFGWFTEHLFKRHSAALRAHMKEEGENLKRIIESPPPSPGGGASFSGASGPRLE